MLRALESVHKILSESTWTTEQNKISYTLKHSEIKRIRTSAYYFCSFPFKQNEPQQRIARYSQLYHKYDYFKTTGQQFQRYKIVYDLKL